MRLTGILIIALSICINSCSQISDDYVNKRQTYFAYYLDRFPPNIKDSIELNTIKKQLLCFMDTFSMIEKERLTKNKFQYYYQAAKLNEFAFNLNIKGSREKCEGYYKKALEQDPKSIKARMGLSALYTNYFNPDDTSSFRKVDAGFDLLNSIYEEGRDTIDPALYSNRFFYGMLYRSDAIRYDALFKCKRYLPLDTSVSGLKSLLDATSVKKIYMSLNNSYITYENRVANFKISYPVEFILYNENPTDKYGNAITLMVETSMTKGLHEDTFRNSISITAQPIKNIDRENIIKRIIERIGKYNGERISLIKNAKSVYVSSNLGREDEYKGIITSFQNNAYFFIITYMATNSTYNKNLKYFVDFENSFKFLE